MADTTQTTQQSQTQSSTAQHSFETDAEVLDSLRTSPAAHLGEDMARATELGGQAVGLRERSFAVQLGLRATPGTASAEALESALGITLPGRVGEVTGDEAGLHTLWLSPDEFLTVDVSRRQRPGETPRRRGGPRGTARAGRGSLGQPHDPRTHRGEGP